jgi:hypothetical protein
VAEQLSPSEKGLSTMKLGSLLGMFTSHITVSDCQSSEECFDVSVHVGHFLAVYDEYHQYTENRI